MSSSKNSSIVWTYLKKLDSSSGSCNLCGKIYKSSGNTTNLATHLKSKHYHAYGQLSIKEKTNIKKAITKNAEENYHNMSVALLPRSKSNTSLSDSNSFCDKNEDLVNQVTFFDCIIFYIYILHTLNIYILESRGG